MRVKTQLTILFLFRFDWLSRAIEVFSHAELQFAPVRSTLSGECCGCRRSVLAGFDLALSIAPAPAATAHIAPCPRPGALGTSRILGVDAATTPRVGLKSFPETLPLADHEVVLTFDDGPWPATTSRVLAALAQECVHATFFLIGRSASEHRELVRRIAAEGHTVGTHTWSHPSLMRIKPEAAIAEIDRGISAVETALHGNADPCAVAPFFRFPGFRIRPLQRSICCIREELWCSAPICGRATGTG